LKISRESTDWLLLAGFCAFLFFFGLAYFGLIGADEPRYAQVAREMLARHD
jgi:4-amino-4-deoxy-L-arabinose transferase-like glycosyltransferase